MNEYDERCKSRLNYKGVLAFMLKSLVKEYKDHSLKEIETFIEEAGEHCILYYAAADDLWRTSIGRRYGSY